jgi:hypothetical protein
VQRGRRTGLRPDEAACAALSRGKTGEVEQAGNVDTVTNFQRILDRIRGLAEVLDAINDRGLHYGLFGGAYVSTMTGYRLSADADFLLADQDFPAFGDLFPTAKIEETGHSTFIYPDEGQKIEFMTRSAIRVAGSEYEFRLTGLAWEHTTRLTGLDWAVRLGNPVDTILLKAMLQRGPEEGKHDLEDVQALLRVVEVDCGYLEERLAEVNADERVRGFLDRLVHPLK